MNGTGIFARQRSNRAPLTLLIVPGALLGFGAVATSQSPLLARIAEIGTVVLGVLVALACIAVGVIVLVARSRGARHDDQLAAVHTLSPRATRPTSEQIGEEAA